MRFASLIAIAAALSLSTGAHAEGQIRIAQQFGIGYLILDVVQDQKLIEKYGKQQGIDIKVEWNSISGATAMNEALLAGALDVVSAGVPPMLTLWDRTRGRQNVKAIASLGSMPNYLLSNNPRVRTLQDLSDKDRIAVPAAGVGYQSRTLQIETARVFGKADYREGQEKFKEEKAKALLEIADGEKEVAEGLNSRISSRPLAPSSASMTSWPSFLSTWAFLPEVLKSSSRMRMRTPRPAASRRASNMRSVVSSAKME